MNRQSVTDSIRRDGSDESKEYIMVLSRHLSMIVLLSVMLVSTLFSWASGEERTTANQRGVVLLKEEVVLYTDVIRLGDLFSGLRAYSESIIGESPKAGDSKVIHAESLWRIANGYGLNWTPANSRIKVTIKRASYSVNVEELVDLVKRSYNFHISGEDVIEVAMSIDKPLYFPQSSPFEDTRQLSIKDFTYSNTSAKFSATIYLEGGSKYNQDLRGYIFRLQELPLATRAIRANEVIEAEDITLEYVRNSVIRRDDIRDINQIIGMTPRRVIKRGDSFRIRSIERPLLVKKKEEIIVLYELPGMSMQLRATAMDSGSKGDIIKVMNNSSKRVLEVEVIGDKIGKLANENSIVKANR